MGRRVLVLAPMPNEMRAVQRALGDRSDVVTGRTGIGPDRAAAVTRRLLAEQRFDHVVVSGIAGGLAPASAVGDLLVPAEVVDGATGAVFLAAPLGPVVPTGRLRTVGIGSYEDTDEDRARYVAEGAAAVDMETAGVARAATEAGVPWTAFRAVSDMAGDPSVGPAVMGMVDEEGRPRAGAALRFLVMHPHRIPRLARLGRDASRAARVAAEAVGAALGPAPREQPAQTE